METYPYYTYKVPSKYITLWNFSDSLNPPDSVRFYKTVRTFVSRLIVRFLHATWQIGTVVRKVGIRWYSFTPGPLLGYFFSSISGSKKDLKLSSRFSRKKHPAPIHESNIGLPAQACRVLRPAASWISCTRDQNLQNHAMCSFGDVPQCTRSCWTSPNLPWSYITWLHD